MTKTSHLDTQAATDSSLIGKSQEPKPSNMRWWICGLLLTAMVINYVHRQTIGVLKPELQAAFGLDEIGYADVVFWFQAAYALGYVSFGRIIDKVGERIGYAVAFTLWTISHIATGLVGSATQLIMARFALGIGESSSFPASLRTIAEWFPKKERALAAGIFNAGAAIGAIVAPLVVPILTLAYGWRSAFVVTGVVSFIWLFAWLKLYKRPQEHKGVNQAEMALIRSDPDDPVKPVSWFKLLFAKETWAYAIGKFLIDPIWWFYLFWLPGFIRDEYHMDLKTFGPPLIAIYLISDVGSVGGGWLSSRLIKTGMSINWARKITLLICALCVLPIFLVDGQKDIWVVVLLIGIATAAHQAFSANLYTLPSDLFPRSAVGSVIGIGGMVGAIGGMLFAKYVGYILDATGSYKTLFYIAGSVYLLAVLLIHIISPKYEPNKKFSDEGA